MIAPRWTLLASIAFGVLAFTNVSYAQAGKATPQPMPKQEKPVPSTAKPTYADFNLATSVGSFKMLEYNDDAQPEGHFEFTFTGTVLVDTTEAFKHNRNLTTQVKVEGNVIKELTYHGRTVYHGTGKMTIDGGWHALQFFGRDLKGKFNGYSVFRLAGEFDKNLETGFYWYTDGKKEDWGTGGNQPTVPKTVYGIEKPKIKINGKGG